MILLLIFFKGIEFISFKRRGRTIILRFHLKKLDFAIGNGSVTSPPPPPPPPQRKNILGVNKHDFCGVVWRGVTVWFGVGWNGVGGGGGGGVRLGCCGEV